MPVFGTGGDYSSRFGRPPSSEFKVGETVFFCLPYKTYKEELPIIPTNTGFLVEKVEEVLDMFKEGETLADEGIFDIDDPRKAVGHTQWVTITLPRNLGTSRFSGAYLCHTPR